MLQLEDPRPPAGCHLLRIAVGAAGGALQSPGHVGQRGTLEVATPAEPTERRDGIGGGEVDVPGIVQPEQSPADAERGNRRSIDSGEQPLADHRGQIVGGFHVCGVEPPALPRIPSRIATEERHYSPPAWYRIDPVFDPDLRSIVGFRLPRGQRPVEQWSSTPCHKGADDVFDEKCATCVWALVGGGDESATVPGRQPKHQVGEGQVGDQPPLGHQSPESIQFGGRQVRVLARKPTDVHHEPEPTPAPPGCRRGQG